MDSSNYTDGVPPTQVVNKRPQTAGPDDGVVKKATIIVGAALAFLFLVGVGLRDLTPRD